MAEISQYYANLELLKHALIEERRTLIQDWAEKAEPGAAPELGEMLQSIQASLEALETLMNDERREQGHMGVIIG